MNTAAEDAWAPGPLRPSFADGAVDVWRADLATVAIDLEELLCSEERARAARIVDERDAQLWRRSRGLLRALLGRYLGREPGSLRFATGEHGKPALVEQDTDASAATPQTDASRAGRVAFNMSHSAELALYAFSRAGAVGVDVEVARRPINEVGIAARMLGQAEADRLQAIAPPSRGKEFLHAWARHEAELKCLGVGIGGGAADDERGRLWVAALEVGHEAGAAVAAEQPVRELRCWDWQI